MSQLSDPQQQTKLPWVEFILPTKDVGTFVWLLPESISKEFRELPQEVRDERERMAMNRFRTIAMMAFGLLKHPELENSFGLRLNGTLEELLHTMAQSVEKPPKPQ